MRTISPSNGSTTTASGQAHGKNIKPSTGLGRVFGTPTVYMRGGSKTPPENEKFKYCPMCGRKLKEAKP